MTTEETLAMKLKKDELENMGRTSKHTGQKQTYTFDEAYKSSLEYFKGDELAARVWVTKYALKDSYGNIYEINPDDMHHRIARELARIEAKYPNPMSEPEIYEYLQDFKYIVPQGSPMTGIGNNFQIASLSELLCNRQWRRFIWWNYED